MGDLQFAFVGESSKMVLIRNKAAVLDLECCLGKARNGHFFQIKFLHQKILLAPTLNRGPSGTKVLRNVKEK
jgi:hypothetical protein